MNIHFITTAIGRIVKPEQKISNDRKWYAFLLAINKPKYDKVNKEWISETIWLSCRYFPYSDDDKKPRMFQEGRSVMVCGEVSAEAWETNGTLRTGLSMIVKEFANLPNDSRAFQELQAKKYAENQAEIENQTQTAAKTENKNMSPPKPVEKIYEKPAEPAPDIHTLEEQSGDLPQEKNKATEDDMPF